MDLDLSASASVPASMTPRVDEKSEASPTRLIEGLAAIIAQAGYERLVCAALTLADATHFPDRWHGGAASATRVALRLVHYAGLEGMDVEVDVVAADATPAGGRPEVRPGEALAAWFVGLVPGKIQLALDRRALSDPLLVVAALARAVAQAFAVIYKIVKNNGEPQSEWIDLCASYLGFGVLTTNAALRYLNSSGGGVARVQNLGRLSWDEQAYVLAVIAQVRQLSKTDLETLARCLSREQQQAFRAHMVDLRQQGTAALAQRLSLPAARYWPPPVDLAALQKPMPQPKEADDAVDRGVVGQNRGKPVFRVQRRMGLRLFKIGLGASFAGGMLMRLDSANTVDPSAMAVMSLAGVLGLSALGALFKESRCSEAKCDAKLKVEDRICPRCSGDVVGVISHPRERLAAEEQWLASQRQSANVEVTSLIAATNESSANLRGLGTSSSTSDGAS